MAVARQTWNQARDPTAVSVLLTAAYAADLIDCIRAVYLTTGAGACFQKAACPLVMLLCKWLPKDVSECHSAPCNLWAMLQLASACDADLLCWAFSRSTAVHHGAAAKGKGLKQAAAAGWFSPETSEASSQGCTDRCKRP